MSNVNVDHVGNGKVVLLSGGGKIFTDIAARFVRGNKPMDEIVASPYDANIVNNIIDCGHLAATEFDYFIFGVEGYSRVCETQLVRKRLASYLIKSGRVEFNGNRQHNYVIPKELKNLTAKHRKIFSDGTGERVSRIDVSTLLEMVDALYTQGLAEGVPEESLRYLKPQATEYKAIIGMNAHALIDWFKIRCCLNAQKEIRDLASKMLKLCKDAAPDLFKNAGPSCMSLGYCPENNWQNEKCKGRIFTQEKAMDILKDFDVVSGLPKDIV